jgi:hypothetical protein
MMIRPFGGIVTGCKATALGEGAKYGILGHILCPELYPVGGIPLNEMDSVKGSRLIC